MEGGRFFVEYFRDVDLRRKMIDDHTTNGPYFDLYPCHQSGDSDSEMITQDAPWEW